MGIVADELQAVADIESGIRWQSLALVIERHGNRERDRERERERVRSEAATSDIPSLPPPRSCVASSRSQWRSDGLA